MASEIERRNLLRNVRERGDQLRAGLDRLVKRYPDQLSGAVAGACCRDSC